MMNNGNCGCCNHGERIQVNTCGCQPQNRCGCANTHRPTNCGCNTSVNTHRPCPRPCPRPRPCGPTPEERCRAQYCRCMKNARLYDGEDFDQDKERCGCNTCCNRD